MPIIGSLGVIVGVSSGQFSAGMDDVGKNLDSVAKSADRAGKSFDFVLGKDDKWRHGSGPLKGQLVADDMDKAALSTSQFRAGFKLLGGTLGQSGGAVTRAAAAFGPLGIAIGATVVGAGLLEHAVMGTVHSFIAHAEAATQAILDTGRLARTMHLSADSVTTFQAAARDANIPFEELQVGISTFRDQLGDLQNGNANTARTFTQLGLSADAFAGQNLDRSISILADQLNALPSDAARSAAAFQLFGARGAELLPFFAQGAAGLSALRDRLQSLGIAVGDTNTRDLQNSVAALHQMQDAIGGLWKDLAIVGGPFITEISHGLTDALEILRSLSGGTGEWREALKDISRSLGSDIGDALRFISDLWKSLGGNTLDWSQAIQTVGRDLQTGILRPLQLVLVAVGVLTLSLSALPGAVGDRAAAATQSIRDAVQLIEERLNSLNGPTFTPISTPTDALPQTNAYAAMSSDLRSLTLAWRDNAESMGFSARQTEIWRLAQRGAKDELLQGLRDLDAALTAQEAWNDEVKRGNDLIAATRNPMEKFAQRWNDINKMFEDGVIDADTYGRALGDLASDIEKTAGAHDLKGPAALEAGSSAAQSAINAAQRNDVQKDPIDRMREAVQAQLGVQQQQLTTQRRLVDAVESGEFFSVIQGF